MQASIRRYNPSDLGPVLQLWEQTGSLPRGADGLTVDQAVELLGHEGGCTLVAEAHGQLVGLAIGMESGPLGWVQRLTVLPEGAAGEALSGQLLETLEGELADRGARKLLTMVSASDQAHGFLRAHGYSSHNGIAYLERELPATVPFQSALIDAGARLIEPGLWEELKGLEEAKQVIERRVILPLSEPGLAARHAVQPPKAIVLFGPPGTGKTTFAKGIASRLGWPFVEIQPSELAAEGPDRQAKLLADIFDRVLALSTTVVFVDEVEDIAATRSAERRVSPSVSNEFLRQIPRMRNESQHLLVCATNWVGRLDSAFLRPGRFDYVLPVGPPGPDARASIWRRYIDEITDEPVDLEELVTASEMFTPADIEFAARKAAQLAFEREHLAGPGSRAVTLDFLAAIQATRPTLSQALIDSFDDETQRFART